MSKYPQLIKIFPDDIVDQSLTKLEESEEAYKEFLLELCHNYGLELVSTFWAFIAAAGGRMSKTMTLESFEKAKEHDKE